jgi:hypothetical protein
MLVYNLRMSKIINLVGIKKNRLTIVSFSHIAKNRTYWLAKCDCGNETIVAGAKFNYGSTKSCGCAQREAVGSLNRTHGKANKENEYAIWKNMRGRCNNPNDAAFYNYGGRGITVCERWNDYSNFIADMGRRPSKKHSLDRIDNTQGYSPDNCRWVTRDIQNRNKRTSKILTYNGESLNSIDMAKKYGINYQTFMSRLARGLSVADAIHYPAPQADSAL